jgi:predicted esterase YcpF (UPF0227 family)
VKDKIERAKRIVKEYGVPLAYVTGVAMGGYYVYTVMSSTTMPRHIELQAHATPDQLKRAIDSANGLPLMLRDTTRDISIKLYTENILES